MKKRLLALCCALALLAAAVPWSAALESEERRAWDTLTTLELTQGIFPQEQALLHPATRAQGAALLVRMAGCEAEAAQDAWVSDLQDISGWAADAIRFAHHQGWTSGVAQGYFAPNESLSANAWFAFLLRALGYSDQNGDFQVAEAARFARRIGLSLRDYPHSLTQGQLAQSALDALTYPGKDGQTMIRRLAQASPSVQAAANALGLLDAEMTPRQAADRLLPAVFRLDIYETEEELRKDDPASNSSGFFISADGVAVTNYHSIDGGIYANIQLSGGEVYPVERVLYWDEGADLAVLRVSRTSDKGEATSVFPFLEMIGAQDAHMGDPVYTLGNPLGLGFAISTGIVSATQRQVPGYSVPCVMNTADVSRGSSGGALLNVRGQVIGVTTGAYINGNNMYLAVPVDSIMAADFSGEGWTLEELMSARTE